MLLSALNIPYDKSLCDTPTFTARIDAEVSSREFDVLVLPAQPYLVSPETYERRTHMVRSTWALIRWLTDLSARKQALIVCGTTEPAKEVLCRTALVAFNGKLIARHVKSPRDTSSTLRTLISRYITVIELPHVPQQASILLDDDLWCPMPLVAVSRSCICLVSCLSASPRLVERARSIAVELGVFVVLSAYQAAGSSEFSRSQSTILSPSGNEISDRAGAPSLLFSEIPDVPAWTETKGRLDLQRKAKQESNRDGWSKIGRDLLNKRSGFYVP